MKSLRALAVFLIILLVSVSAAEPHDFPPCGAMGNWYSIQPQQDPVEWEWDYGGYHTKDRMHGQRYGNIWHETAQGEMISVGFNHHLAPPGLYEVSFQIQRKTRFDPCTGVSEELDTTGPTSNVVWSGSLGNKHPSFGGTSETIGPRSILLTLIKIAFENNQNPLGDYVFRIRINGIVNGNPEDRYIDLPTVFNVVAVFGISPEGEPVEQADPRDEEGGGGTTSGGTTSGSTGGGTGQFNYGWFNFLKQLVNPSFWWGLLWPTEEMWLELKADLAESNVNLFGTYMLQALEGSAGYMFEDGEELMVGEITNQLYMPLKIGDYETSITFDFTPFALPLNIVRTLLTGSMIYMLLIWLRDRISKVLSLGVGTLSDLER